MKILLVVFILFAAASAAEYRALRIRADELCHAAQSLAARSGAMSHVLREAAADPFLGEDSLTGAPYGVLAHFRERSRQISTELSARFLPPASVTAFRDLAITRGGGEATRASLEVLPASAARMECGGVTDADEDRNLEKMLHELDEFWAGRKNSAELQKIEFKRDREIFCHGDSLIRKLRTVVDAAEAKCQAAPAGSKLARSCAMRGQADGTGTVRAEIEDLERRKQLNLRKLRSKWPRPVVEGLRC